MYRKILETDEAIIDLSRIMIEAYNYTRDRNSGTVFLNLYDATVANMAFFTNGFDSIGIDYRGYIIRIIPFGNYHLFYVEVDNSIYILRVLYQKQNWQRILRAKESYHIRGNEIN